MDPLASVLSLVKPQSYMSSGFDFGGLWSLQFPAHDSIKCYALSSGECWLTTEDDGPVQMRAGDCFLLPLGRPYRLASDPALTPVDFKSVVTKIVNGGMITMNGGGGCSGLGSFFNLASGQAGALLSVLPATVIVREDAEKSDLRWLMGRVMREVNDPQPGGVLVVQHLAHVMLIQALRSHLARGQEGGVGWLCALSDRHIGLAMKAIHDDPAHPWTLPELAACVGLSRTNFAVRFKAKVGEAPIEYLTRWRMRLAADQLESTGRSISEVSLSLGYDSESAFCTAFKRVMGASPRKYSKNSAITVG